MNLKLDMAGESWFPNIGNYKPPYRYWLYPDYYYYDIGFRLVLKHVKHENSL